MGKVFMYFLMENIMKEALLITKNKEKEFFNFKTELNIKVILTRTIFKV